MRFQKKLILTYSLFMFLVLISVGVLFYLSNVNFLEENTDSTYTLLTESIAKQIDEMYEQMDYILINILSEESVKSVIETLANIDHEDADYTEYLIDAVDIFYANLQKYSILRNYQSVIFMNSRGDFFSSNFKDHNRYTIPCEVYEEYPWTAEDRGNRIYIAPYQDPLIQTEQFIFGLGRKLSVTPGIESYLIAQKPLSDLKRILSIDDDPSVRILIMDQDQLFYASEDIIEDEYQIFLEADFNHGEFSKNPISGKQEMFFSSSSVSTGLQVILSVEDSIISEGVRSNSILIIAGFLIVLILSLVFNFYSSRFLTRPLSQITKIMNETELNKTPDAIDVDIEHDEVLELSNAFYELVERLNAANKRELHYTSAWMQAKFDALQEQVNPHFIFNTLTTISKRGLEIGDDEICTICDNLAGMLRYSTSTAKRTATIKEELNHVENYLFLMKKRLGKRLEFSIQADPLLMDNKIPKIIIQEIVSNALKHGFEHIQRTKRIEIQTEKSVDRGVIKVIDNGEGFPPEVREQLLSQIDQIRAEVLSGKTGEGFKIGGMGIPNTYLRLLTFFGRSVTLDIRNNEESGASITFSFPLDQEEVSHE